MALVSEYVLTRKDGVVIHKHYSNLPNGYVHNISEEFYDKCLYCIEPCNIEIEEVTFEQLPEDIKKALEVIPNEQENSIG